MMFSSEDISQSYFASDILLGGMPNKWRVLAGFLSLQASEVRILHRKYTASNLFTKNIHLKSAP